MIYLFIILFSYCFSVVFNSWTEPDMIFGFYYEWLKKIGNVELNDDGTIKSYRKFIKPLGWCMICTNVWITAFLFATTSIFYPMQYIYLIPCIIFSNWLVIKFN